MSKTSSIPKSFGYAIQGIRSTFKKEPNFRVHILLGFFAIIFAYILKFQFVEWVVLLLAIFIVLILELINTSIESIVDIVSPEKKEEAKVAKDVGAAAVMMGAILSVLIGLLLFLPKII